MNCIFCKINNGEIPSQILYEDDVVKVIMDANPTSNGHILIIPVKHYNDFLNIDDNTLIHIHKIAKLMKKYLFESLNPDGLALINNYGINQLIKHYHLHLIPVYKEKQPIKNINDIYQKIRSVI
ncbi:MAG: HIT domain-containing protein [Bacilli bacterium]|nr:HIT domain-containing protein [Bacilli bacterium]MDD3895660.1 HIT domain-containing protein [Bacilli bacterium]